MAKAKMRKNALRAHELTGTKPMRGLAGVAAMLLVATGRVAAGGAAWAQEPAAPPTAIAPPADATETPPGNATETAAPVEATETPPPAEAIETRPPGEVTKTPTPADAP